MSSSKAQQSLSNTAIVEGSEDVSEALMKGLEGINLTGNELAHMIEQIVTPHLDKLQNVFLTEVKNVVKDVFHEVTLSSAAASRASSMVPSHVDDSGSNGAAIAPATPSAPSAPAAPLPRCSATTKQGTRCQRSSLSETIHFCKTHQPKTSILPPVPMAMRTRSGAKKQQQQQEQRRPMARPHPASSRIVELTDTEHEDEAEDDGEDEVEDELPAEGPMGRRTSGRNKGKKPQALSKKHKDDDEEDQSMEPPPAKKMKSKKKANELTTLMAPATSSSSSSHRLTVFHPATRKDHVVAELKPDDWDDEEEDEDDGYGHAQPRESDQENEDPEHSYHLQLEEALEHMEDDRNRSNNNNNSNSYLLNGPY